MHRFFHRPVVSWSLTVCAVFAVWFVSQPSPAAAQFPLGILDDTQLQVVVGTDCDGGTSGTDCQHEDVDCDMQPKTSACYDIDPNVCTTHEGRCHKVHTEKIQKCQKAGAKGQNCSCSATSPSRLCGKKTDAEIPDGDPGCGENDCPFVSATQGGKSVLKCQSPTATDPEDCRVGVSHSSSWRQLLDALSRMSLMSTFMAGAAGFGELDRGLKDVDK